MKSFEKILEAVQNLNSEKETKLKDYQDKLAYFNANKTKFVSILKTKKPDQWELEANKIIKGNVYLTKKWALDKLQFTIDQDLAKVTSNEMTTEEEKQINLNIAKNRIDLNKNKIALDRLIKDDLRTLQSL